MTSSGPNRARAIIGANVWPGLNETEVRKVTQADCKEWARAYSKTVSPTRYNNTVSVLRHVLNVAIECGVVYNNAAAAVKRAPVRGKEIALPTIDKFKALISEMRTGHSRDSINRADFAAGLAFTGRKGKAGANGGKAAEFRYPWLQTENPDDDVGFDL